MKRFVFLLTTIFMCTISHAETFNQYWYVENNTPIQTTCETGGDITLPAAPTKYGYDFIGWEKLSYIRIEYLESTGTQYIDTGFKPNQNSGLDIDFFSIRPNSIPGMVSDDNIGYFFGVSVASIYTEILVYNTNGDMNTQYCYANGIYGHGTGKYKVHLRENSVNIIAEDGSSFKKTFEKTYYQISENFTLFERNTIIKGVTSGHTVKIYSCKIYDNDILVRDFIPVLDLDGVPCMFDRVEGKFYYNAGTGQFVAGPVIGE